MDLVFHQSSTSLKFSGGGRIWLPLKFHSLMKSFKKLFKNGHSSLFHEIPSPTLQGRFTNWPIRFEWLVQPQWFNYQLEDDEWWGFWGESVYVWFLWCRTGWVEFWGEPLLDSLLGVAGVFLEVGFPERGEGFEREWFKTCNLLNQALNLGLRPIMFHSVCVRLCLS